MQWYGSQDRDATTHDILPIFIVEDTQPAKPIDVVGTGFIIGPDLLVTCWHCVSTPLPTGRKYAAVAYPWLGYTEVLDLDSLEQDANRTDLATANLKRKPMLGLSLTDARAAWGTGVCTFRYPLSDYSQQPDGNRQIILNPRYLQGYVTRAFDHEDIRYGSTPSYELDMPTPAGLSGAPLIRMGSMEVIGVVYKSHDVATIEHFGQMDSKTGKREPDAYKIVSFGLAHDTNTLKNLRGTATRGLPLIEYLARLGSRAT